MDSKSKYTKDEQNYQRCDKLDDKEATTQPKGIEENNQDEEENTQIQLRKKSLNEVDCIPGVKERRKTISKCISRMFLYMHVRDWKKFDKYCDYLMGKHHTPVYTALVYIYRADKLRMMGKLNESVKYFPAIESLIQQSEDSQFLTLRFLTTRAFALHDMGKHKEARYNLNQAVQLSTLQETSNPTTYNMTIYAYSGLIHHTDEIGYVPSEKDLQVAESYFVDIPVRHSSWLDDLNDEPKMQEEMSDSLVPWTATDYIFLLLRSCPEKGFIHFEEFEFDPANLPKIITYTVRLKNTKMNEKCEIRYHLIQCDIKLRQAQFEDDTNKKTVLYQKAQTLACGVVATGKKGNLVPYAVKCLQYRLEYIRKCRNNLPQFASLFVEDMNQDCDAAIKTVQESENENGKGRNLNNAGIVYQPEEMTSVESVSMTALSCPHASSLDQQHRTLTSGLRCTREDIQSMLGGLIPATDYCHVNNPEDMTARQRFLHRVGLHPTCQCDDCVYLVTSHLATCAECGNRQTIPKAIELDDNEDTPVEWHVGESGERAESLVSVEHPSGDDIQPIGLITALDNYPVLNQELTDQHRFHIHTPDMAVEDETSAPWHMAKSEIT